MYLRKWSRYTLHNPMLFIHARNPSWFSTMASFDTETTGLNIVHDKPFILTFAFGTKPGEGEAYAYDLSAHTKAENDALIQWLYDVTKPHILAGHNIAFDLSMLNNIGKRITHDNLVDTQTLIRLGTDAIPTKAGGAPLGLKDFATRFIDKDANQYEKKINSEKAKIAKDYKQRLLGIVPNKRRILETLETFPNDIDDLIPEDKAAYLKWFETLPRHLAKNITENFPTSQDIPYDLIPRDILMEYAQFDAIYTHEIYEQLMPIVTVREQLTTLESERKLIVPLFEMINVGFIINKPYVIQAKKRLKDYINERIKHLHILAEMPLKPGQNKVILELLQTKFSLPDLENTQEETLSELVYTLEQLDQNLPARTLISIILELRTLSKWYTTYLMRFYNEMQFHDDIYTGLNPAGAVTGRFTSDFQQFPKGPIKDYNGEELFHPRKMVITKPGTYLFYLDYSQIELRIQALYTILLGEPDLNLCRAYFPYKCHHYTERTPYDYRNPLHLAQWNQTQPETRTSIWLRDEDEVPWVKTDLHSKTTSNIFPDLDPESEEFEKLRSAVGKRTNFACNYGAKAGRLHTMFPRYSKDFAFSIYNGYATTYPGVIQYQRYCSELFRSQPYGENLFGRKYYGTNGHNGANALVQGSGADLLKEKIVEINKFLKPYKTKMQMNIHDEISFVMPKDEIFLIPKLKAIMEDVPNTFVPIVAEAEITETTWAEKRKFIYAGTSIEYPVKSH